ncbi:MFS transporter [Granulicoccus sp. GXG6511]|uniref:MFS transporter n=1 Tax=Granulicoccus sp. GXG6511 TaxID=3381351 RepID=UPI003D7DA7AB
MSAPVKSPPQAFQGNDKLLIGLVLSIVSYWLFAISLGTVAPKVMEDLNRPGAAELLSPTAMNLAVALTGLVSGLFIVLMGGLADRYGRVRLTLIGNALNIVGCLFIVFATGGMASTLLIIGRAIQGLSAACVMPATIAMVKAYWDGPGRQRAVSMWSIGSFGGAGLAAFVGGLTATTLNWRWIFIFSMIVSVVAAALVWGTPESKVAPTGERKRFDIGGLLIFLVMMLGLMMVLTFGGKSEAFAWTSPLSLGMLAVFVVGLIVFVFVERGRDNAFIDFRLFKNMNFTGTVAANFAMNSTLGLLIVSQQLLARDDRLDTLRAGALTLGYPLMVILFIRAGEKLLQRFGPRKPMIWGSLLVAVAAAILMLTNLHLSVYMWLAVVAYALFGLGLAFFATPATDACLTSLPPEQAGSGMGIFKMASSLGGAIGTAVALSLFLGFQQGTSGNFIGDVLEMTGRQDNLAIRQAAAIAIGGMLVFALIAALVAAVAVPKGKKED